MSRRIGICRPSHQSKCTAPSSTLGRRQWLTRCIHRHKSICANNCTYVNAIGTVGNYHIGIYTRFLLMFLVDPLTQPNERLMKLWIDFTRTIKARAPGGAFEFFTYAELLYWFCFVILINPFRWKWAAFVLFGIGVGLPKSVVAGEQKLRDNAGYVNGNGYAREKNLR